MIDFATGARCLGAPAFVARGCGGPRVQRSTGDYRLRWCCARCAERVATTECHAGRPLAGPRQLPLFAGASR